MTSNNLAAFRFQAEVTEDGLKIAYSVRNLSDRDLGIFNRIPTVNGSGSAIFLPATVYADMEGPTLHISKVVLPLPEGLNMTGRPVPNVTRVPTGAEFSEAFALSLPLPVFNPFKRAQIAGSVPSKDIAAVMPVFATSVRVSIGIFAAVPAIAFLPVSPDAPDTFRVWPPGPAITGQVVLSEAVALSSSITVLTYTAIPRHV